MPIRLTQSALLTIMQPWSEVVEPIYKRVAQIAEADEWGETLWVGCGSGRSVVWWTKKFQLITQGLDPDPEAVEKAEARIRGTDMAKKVTFQVADPSDLPHEDHVFDSVVVHTLYLREVDMATVIREAARVLRPMGNIVVIAPSWLQTPKEKDANRIASLGFTPRVTMEWKRHLRSAGVIDLIVEEAVKDGNWFAPSMFALFARGWRAAGWAGVRAMLSREVWVLRRLVRKRVLGLSILKGTRWPHR